MADAELEKTIAKISISNNDENLTAQGEVLKFEGFLKVYREGKDDDEEEDNEEGMLPPLVVGQSLTLKEMIATEGFTRPPARYTEASLVKKLEELGIGRPSTYAPTISTILKRTYVEKRDKEGIQRIYQVLSMVNDVIKKKQETETTGAEKSKLFPSDLGLVVTDFLIQHFENVMDYGFTAKIEGNFDEIAHGKMKWNSMVGDFYTPFKSEVDNTMETAERIKGEREIGIDPVSGKKVIARMGRYGPMVQIGDVNDEIKPRFAKLKQDQSIETITYEAAMELFKLPRNLGIFEDQDVLVSIGKFGPYISHNKQFYSLSKEFDPYAIALEEAIPIVEEKRKSKNERTVKVFDKEKIQILKGPYGLNIKIGLKNIPIPKEQQETAADLSIDEVKQMIEYAIANPPKKTSRKKKS
jgi:DNA topoisomerase-1